MSETSETTVLAIGAHPDDIEFGCGGILLKEAKKGTCVHFLVCSKGESGSNGSAAEREKESVAAAKLLGASVDFIDCGGDGKIERSPATSTRIAAKIRELRPRIVLAPSLAENQHPDHVAIGQSSRDAARLARYAGFADLQDQPAHEIDSLLFYAITPGAEPKEAPFVFDISGSVEDWEKLMCCHATQMKTRSYCELQLSRARTLGLQAGCDYAQALWPNDGVVVESLNSVPRGLRLF